MTPSIRLTADHASNRSLAQDAEPGEGIVIDAGARLQRATEVSLATFDASVRGQRYNGNTYADSDDYSLELNLRTTLERRSFEMSGFDRAQNTLLSELESSGLIETDARRRDRGASIGMTLDVSERLQAGLRGSYSDVRYSGRNAALFPGYGYPALAVDANYSLNDRSTLFASATAGVLSVPGSPFGTRDTGTTAGFTHELGQRYTLEMAGGYNRTESFGRSDAGWTGRVSLERRAQKSSWEIGIDRSVQPSGLGALVRRTVASAQYGVDMTSRLRFVTSARSTRNESVLDVTIGERRQVEDAEMRLEWRMNQNWAVGLKAGFARAGGSADALVTTDEIFEGWRAGFTLGWNPQPRPMRP